MKASLTATLICLCTQVCAMPSAPATPHTGLLAEEAKARDTGRRATRHDATVPPPPAPARERGLLLAGFALMAGITLRRLGDGSP